MPRKITDRCIGCCTCKGECPVEAISENGDVCVIDPDVCIDCGACEAACPTESISEE